LTPIRFRSGPRGFPPAAELLAPAAHLYEECDPSDGQRGDETADEDVPPSDEHGREGEAEREQRRPQDPDTGSRLHGCIVRGADESRSILVLGDCECRTGAHSQWVIRGSADPSSVRGMTAVDVSPEERKARGRACRSETPRSSHGEWKPPPERVDPVAVLQAQAKTRLPELVPVRHQRMLVSPFTFYRGAAAIMAADLAHTPNSGITVQCCGDAHLANFGGFESPERVLVFDINDFDETLPGPWEWDVKRLVASFAIAAQDREFDEKIACDAVTEATRSYRTAMQQFAQMRNLDVWYARLDVQATIARWRSELTPTEVKQLEKGAAKAVSKNSLKAFSKLTEIVNGEPHIISDPPLIVRVRDLVPDADVGAFNDLMQRWLASYAMSLETDRRRLLDSYRFVDFALKVVGVGSVGTRCFIALFLGRDDNDPLFLQIKEAEASVLEPYLAPSAYEQHGARVVHGQRYVQAASDIFLGWAREKGVDDVARDFYIRQLWDGKVSADLTTMPPSQLRMYGRMCGWTLARAHARSGDRVAIAGYLGSSEVFDRAMVEFALSYAEQNARDYETVAAAAAEGRIPVA
jgi:uncharacterized protein (DUF2252 family)